jgi:hypothetical protein
VTENLFRFATQKRSDTVETDVSSSYRSPDPKKQLSVRVRTSIHTKLDFLLECWRARAKGQGDDVEEIDTTYLVDHLMADKTDEEVAQFGGWPKDAEAKAKLLKDLATPDESAPKKKH